MAVVRFSGEQRSVYLCSVPVPDDGSPSSQSGRGLSAQPVCDSAQLGQDHSQQRVHRTHVHRAVCALLQTDTRHAILSDQQEYSLQIVSIKSYIQLLADMVFLLSLKTAMTN